MRQRAISQKPSRLALLKAAWDPHCKGAQQSHRWLLESSTPISYGTCALCGERRLHKPLMVRPEPSWWA